MNIVQLLATLCLTGAFVLADAKLALNRFSASRCGAKNKKVKIEPIGKPTKLGEGPHWDSRNNVLYYVDILNSTVFKYDPATNTETSVTVDGGQSVSIVIPVEGKKDKFVITRGRSVAVMTWDGKSSKPSNVDVISTVDNEEDTQDNVFNDGKVDPTGRLWAGTSNILRRGSLFSFSKDGNATIRVSNIILSNGMTWSLDAKTMYYIDSLNFWVDAFDFNAQSGELSNRRVVFDFKKNNIVGAPDGMTIDTKGMLWIACFGGGQVIRVDPNTGKLLCSISVPSPQTTSVVFGGANLDELYITSSNIPFGEFTLTEEQLKIFPYISYTFRVTRVGAKGLPMKNANFA